MTATPNHALPKTSLGEVARFENPPLPCPERSLSLVEFGDSSRFI